MTGRVLNRATAGLVLIALSLGVPAMLAAGIGWPLPSRLPSWDETAVVLTSPPTGELILNVVAIWCWILWGYFITSLVGDLAWMARHWRHPDRRIPARGFTFALLAALLTGSFGGTAAVVVAPATGVVVEVAAPPAATATAQPATGAVAAIVVEQPVEPADPGPAGQTRRVALWEDAPTILPDPAASGPVLVQVGDDRHTVDVAPGDTLWDLAEAWLGDPARWPEIEQLNRDRHQMRGGGHIEQGWTLQLPDDAAPPTSQPGTPEGGHDDDEDDQPELVHQVATGDWMWHIAGRYLGDSERYPEIAVLNPDLATTYPGYPDHIQPGDRLLLPADAEDGGPRRHATGAVEPADGDRPQQPPEHEPAPPPPVVPDPPDGEATGSPSPDPPPPGVPTQLPDPDRVAPDPGAAPNPPATAPASATPEPTATPSPEAGPGPEAPGDADDQPPADDGDGVALGDGSWIPWAVAAAVASAMAVVWLQRRRRYTPRRLDEIAEDDEFDEPAGTATLAEPAVVSRIRRVLRLRARGDDPESVLDPDPDPDPELALGQPAAAAPPPASERAAEPVPPVPAVEQLPEGGIGIVGPGAEAAARGALVAALSAGAPADPDGQADVVVPADTMVTLLGADAVALGTWRRLRVTADLDGALAVVEARLLGAARLLDEYEITDVATLRAAAPAERPVPPLLLVAPAPPAEVRMRTRNALGLGRGLEVSALLLGPWDHGPTVQVDNDGTCRPVGGATGLPTGVPTRMSVVQQEAAFELLRTIREAHTGDPAPPAAPDPGTGRVGGSGHPAPPPVVEHDGAAAAPMVDEEKTPGGRDDAHLDVPDAAGPPPAPPPSAAGDEDTEQQEQPEAVPRAVARVLGVPEIVGWQRAGRPLRRASVQLLVYLAVHPDGVGPDQIQEDIWPESRRRLAATKLHTAASNLRHLLAAAAGADPEQAGGYVAKHRGRYQLSAQAVELDLWTLREQCGRARRSDHEDQRVEALRQACAAYRGELAAGRDYEWITPHREAARGLALDAHTTLAELLAGHDPREAARLLSRAVEIDPMAETVYRQAMRAHHRIGDAEAIRGLLRQLARNLDSIGAEPAEETVELAEHLRHDHGQLPSRRQDNAT